MALALAGVILRAGPGAGRQLVQALAAQPLVHLPLLVLLYALYAGDPGHNWLGGPVGFWHVRAWGVILAAALAAALGLYASARPGLAGHLTWVVIFVLLSGLLCFSGTRGGVLGVGVAVAVCAATLGRPLWRRLPVFVLSALAGAALSLLPTPPIEDWGLTNSLSEFRADTGELLTAPPEPGGPEPSGPETGSRLSLWAESLDLIRVRPLLGYGHDQFRYHYSQGPDQVTHPHSLPLQALVDFGVIGAAALALLLLSLWVRGAVAARRAPDDGRAGALLAVTTIYAAALVDGALYNVETIAIAAIALAVLLAPRAPSLVTTAESG